MSLLGSQGGEGAVLLDNLEVVIRAGGRLAGVSVRRNELAAAAGVFIGECGEVAWALSLSSGSVLRCL